MDGGLHVQLEKDGSGSTRHTRRRPVVCGLCSMRATRYKSPFFSTTNLKHILFNFLSFTTISSAKNITKSTSLEVFDISYSIHYHI